MEDEADNILASTKLLGKLARVNNASSAIYNEPRSTTEAISVSTNTPVIVEAATSSWYKTSLPNGKRGFIKHTGLTAIDRPVRIFFLKTRVPLFEKPDSLAPKKTSIPTGETVDILGNFESYYLVRTRENITGWITK